MRLMRDCTERAVFEVYVYLVVHGGKGYGGGSGGGKRHPDAQTGGYTHLRLVHSNYVGLVLDMRPT